MMNTSQSTNGLGAKEAIREDTTTEALARRIAELNADLRVSFDRLNSIADRVFGAQPGLSDGSTGIKAAPMGTLGELHDSIDRLEFTTSAARDLITRFSGL